MSQPTRPLAHARTRSFHGLRPRDFPALPVMQPSSPSLLNKHPRHLQICDLSICSYYLVISENGPSTARALFYSMHPVQVFWGGYFVLNFMCDGNRSLLPSALYSYSPHVPQVHCDMEVLSRVGAAGRRVSACSCSHRRIVTGLQLRWRKHDAMRKQQLFLCWILAAVARHTQQMDHTLYVKQPLQPHTLPPCFSSTSPPAL
jgi:hypothetical protein